FLAVLTAAAQIRRGVNAAHRKPRRDARRKRWRERRIESAITVKHRRVVPVLLETLAIGEKHRHFRSVFARIKNLLRGEVVGLERDLRLEEHAALAALKVITIDCLRLGEADVGIEGLSIFPFAFEAARCSESG